MKTPNEKTRVDLCGTELQWVNIVKHLCNYLHSNLCERSEVIRMKGNLVEVNNLLVLQRRIEALIWHLINNVHISMVHLHRENYSLYPVMHTRLIYTIW